MIKLVLRFLAGEGESQGNRRAASKSNTGYALTGEVEQKRLPPDMMIGEFIGPGWAKAMCEERRCQFGVNTRKVASMAVVTATGDAGTLIRTVNFVAACRAMIATEPKESRAGNGK